MEVVLLNLNFESVECCFLFVCLLAFLANSEKHSETLAINLERDCRVGQVVYPTKSFLTHTLDAVTSTSHTGTKYLLLNCFYSFCD